MNKIFSFFIFRPISHLLRIIFVCKFMTDSRCLFFQARLKALKFTLRIFTSVGVSLKLLVASNVKHCLIVQFIE